MTTVPGVGLQRAGERHYPASRALNKPLMAQQDVFLSKDLFRPKVSFGGSDLSSAQTQINTSPVNSSLLTPLALVQKALPSPASQALDSIDKKKQGNILLPTGIPVFYLHGTFTQGDSLIPMVDFIANIQTSHPAYISYMPEVRDGTGIETVSNPKKTLPAYRLAIRDMGDFHYQVAYQNLQKLKNLKAQLASEQLSVEDKEKAFVRFFDLLPQEKDLLMPVVITHLVNRLFELPPEFKKGSSLSDVVSERVKRVYNERDKLLLTEAEKQKPIVDTEFLRTKAILQGKQLNLSVEQFVNDPDTINLRSTINYKDIAVLEAYLMFLEKKLAKAIHETYQAAYQSEVTLGTLTPSALEARAKKTATKLMEKIAPQGMAFGHSQGGTVLMTALLNYLAKAPKIPEVAMQVNAPGFEELGGRYIGIQALFSSPLNGIPEEPLWGKTLSDIVERWIHGTQNKSPWTQWVIRKGLWKVFDHGRPAVQEMKSGSPLMKKIQDLLPLVSNQGITVVAAHDVNDSFIEPAAARLMDKNGQTPESVFNIALEAPIMPRRIEDGMSMIEEEIRNQGMSPNAFAVKLLRWMPTKVKEKIFDVYLGIITGLGQHSALVNHPDFVRKALGEKLIVDPEMQTRVLHTSNFEPFRFQALLARGKSYQKKVLDLPVPDAIKALSVFDRQYPTFLSALIDNAREWVPVQTSAATAATQILHRTMDLIEKVIQDDSLLPKYRYFVQRGLGQMASAQLLPLSKGLVSPSLRATWLLNQLAQKPE